MVSPGLPFCLSTSNIHPSVSRQICRNKLAKEKQLMKVIVEKYPQRNARMLKQKIEEAEAAKAAREQANQEAEKGKGWFGS
jgi:hypothetical protein